MIRLRGVTNAVLRFGTPEAEPLGQFLARAVEARRDNARTAAVDIDWHEGDVEKLPFEAAAFDDGAREIAGARPRRRAARAPSLRLHGRAHPAAKRR